MEAEAESEEERDRERAHDHMIDLIETATKAAKDSNVSVAEFLAHQKDDALRDDDIECFLSYLYGKSYRDYYSGRYCQVW